MTRKQGMFWLTRSLLFKNCIPQGTSLSKLRLMLRPLAASPSSLSLRPAQTQDPAEPFGKNQCHGGQAAGPCFPGLHRIPATTRTSPHLRAPEKLLLSDTRAQPALARATTPAASTQGSHGLTSWAGDSPHPMDEAEKGVQVTDPPTKWGPPCRQLILLDQGKRKGSMPEI